MTAQFYVGRRDPNGKCRVQIDGAERLKLRLDLATHSPTGFEWGYGGSGPAQLALAILADALGDDKAALALHQAFKFRVIGALPRDQAWRLEMSDVLKGAVRPPGRARSCARAAGFTASAAIAGCSWRRARW